MRPTVCWPVRLWVSLVLVVVSLAAPGAVAIRAQATCNFALGFAALHDQLPLEVGQCLENQRATPAGDAEQRTTGGLLAWRKADNWTAFTDGNRTWVNGPQGLQARLNVERFPWESDAAGFPPPAGTAGPAVAPVLAWYYPQFSQDLRSDVQDASGARIDALIVSETGATDLAPYLQAVRGTALRIAAGVEPRYGSPEELRAQLRGILGAYAADPGYLRYQGKPVLVFWNLAAVPLGPGQSPQQSWAAIRDGVDPGRRSIWIGEGADTNPTAGTLSYLPAFDGMHLYSIAWTADPKGQLASWAARVRGADPSKLWVATVMPGGYYGNGSDPSQWQQRDRAAGAYYRATWDGAVATKPAMVIITSYNETNERTEIVRSPEWGTQYLDLTRQAIDSWRG